MKRKSIIYLMVSFFIALAVIGVYQVDNFKVRKVDIDSAKFLDMDNDQYVMKIDNINCGDKYIEINGWAVEKGITHEYFNWVTGEGEGVYNNNKVVLQDDDGNVYAINTISEDRLDVNELISDDINYAKCGFKSLVKRSKLKANNTYKVGVILTTLDKEEILIMSEEEITL